MQQKLGTRLRVNDAVRQFARGPVGVQVRLQQLVQFVRAHRKFRRKQIPPNQKYNEHVRRYWVQNPAGSFSECVDRWWQVRGRP